MNIRRRPLIVGGVALAVAPLIVFPQTTGKVWQIGNLTSFPRPLPPSPPLPIFDAYAQEMRRLGFVEGQDYVWHERNFAGRRELIRSLALELVRLKVDVLSAVGGAAALVAKQVAGPIPVLFVSVPDPVGLGLVGSLARPEGNITGTAFDVTRAIYGKHVELLKEMVPSLSRIAVLTEQVSRHSDAFEYVREAAGNLGVKANSVPVRDERDFDAAFAAMKEQRADGLLVLGEIYTIHRKRIVALVAQNRIPAIYAAFLFAADGGLITYHPDTIEMARQSASQLAKILNGVKPGDIPVEQPKRFRLAINLRTAKTLGLTVPQSLLLRADEVIQ